MWVGLRIAGVWPPNLLHQFKAPNAPEVRAFRKTHNDDKVFLKRARKLDALYMVHKVGLPQ